MNSDGASHQIRPITDAEVQAFSSLVDLAFHENPPPEAHDIAMRLLPRERTMAAFDGAELVGTGGDIPLELTVPGGAAVAAAGVSFITVKPTHRRRGILTRMMRYQLHGLHERGGAPVAILGASEPAIYGRFGYGLGSQELELTIPRGDNGLSAVPGSDPTPVDVVFEVSDPFCAWNTGRWRLRGDADGAVCERTTDPADLVLGPRELGSAYLGGFSLAALGRAGRVEELRPGALDEASRAFVSDVAPWLPFGF